MPQRFAYIPVATLPPLAWCARIPAGSGVATVYHGRNVETSSDFFAEAAWNGRFTGPGLRSATIVCGTGATCDSGSVTFRASTDGQSPLFSVRKSGVLQVSNSPVFALAAAGERPAPLHPFYYHDLTRILRRGLLSAGASLPTASPDATLRIYFFAKMSVRPGLDVTIEPVPSDDKPKTWEEYEALLHRGVRDVFTNARDPARTHAYLPLAQISRGYDSVASAAVGAASGCREAVTIVDSRADDPHRDDGTDIARLLGMQCRSIDRWGYVRCGNSVEAEFAFTTAASTPAWSVIDRDLMGRLVVSGVCGDSIWGKEPSYDFARPWATITPGLSGLEFRLRSGFLTLAVPAIGFRYGSEIAGIERSAGMSRWSVGGSYDRPLPRRIAEQAGVPRSAFGTVKTASGHAQLYRPSHFSPAGLRAYDSFRARSHAGVPCGPLLAARLRCAAEEAAWWCLHGGRRRSAVASRLPWQPVALAGERHAIPWRFRFLFQWTCDSLASRYRLPDREEYGA